MTTRSTLEISCPVCGSTEEENKLRCGKCAWPLVIPYYFVSKPSPEQIEFENKLLQERRKQWQEKLQLIHAEEVLDEKKSAINTKIEENQKIIAQIEAEVLQNKNKETELLKAIPAIKAKTSAYPKDDYSRLNEIFAEDNSRSELRDWFEKERITIIHVNAQLSSNHKLALTFPDSYSLSEFRKIEHTLVLGMHRKKKMYVLADAEMLYKIPVKCPSTRRMNHASPILVDLPFKIHPDFHYLLGNYNYEYVRRHSLLFSFQLDENPTQSK